jgi:hypothetical protein
VYNYCPTAPQDEFIFSEATFPAMVAGFGAGKTDALVMRSIAGKLESPDTHRAFYEPTYDLVRMVAFPRFEQILSEANIPYRLLQTPHNRLDIEGQGSIFFRSMDTPARIIGYQVGDSDVDELDTLKQKDAAECWRRILSRNRQKKKNGKPNTVAVATTPEGFRFVYNTWERDPKPGYQIIRAPSYSNPHLDPAYIQSLRDIYPENLLQAYIEGQFVNLTSGTVYHVFNRKKHNSLEERKPGEPLFIGVDFNVGQMVAIVSVKRAGKPHAVDEFTKVYDTPALIHLLKERLPGHQINIYPDASGDSRKSVNASATDIALLKEAGFAVFAKQQNPPVRDRINSVNGALTHGAFVNVSRCPTLTLCLEQQAYDDHGEPDKKSGLDHANDAWGYFLAYDYPVIKPATSINIGRAF